MKAWACLVLAMMAPCAFGNAVTIDQARKITIDLPASGVAGSLVTLSQPGAAETDWKLQSGILMHKEASNLFPAKAAPGAAAPALQFDVGPMSLPGSYFVAALGFVNAKEKKEIWFIDSVNSGEPISNGEGEYALSPIYVVITNASNVIDKVPPKVLSIAAGPEALLAGKAMQLKLSASDEGSGLGQYWDAELQNLADADEGIEDEPILVAGTMESGTFEVPVPKDTAPGRYALSSLILIDKVGNQREYRWTIENGKATPEGHTFVAPVFEVKKP